MRLTDRAKFFIKAFFLFGYIVIFSTSFRIVHASTFSQDVSTTIQVQSATQMQVTQVETLDWDNTNKFFPAAKNFIEVNIYPPLMSKKYDVAAQVRNLRVTDDAGSVISFTKSVENGAMTLKIPYYQDLKSDQSLVFKISYSTDLFITNEGGLLEIMYVGLPDNFKETSFNKKGNYTEKVSYNLAFVLPKFLGTPSVISPTSHKTTTKSDGLTINYSDVDLSGKSVRIVIGDQRIAKFTLGGKTYATNSSTPGFVKGVLVNYIDVILPTQRNGTESANQTIYYTKISPFPESLTTDSDGNLVARLPVSAVNDGSVDIEGYAVIKTSTLPESMKIAKIADIPAVMLPYLANEPQYWQVSDPAIQTIAKQQLDSSGFMFKTVQQSLGYVVKTLQYADVTSVSALQRQGALGALASKKGVCMEYADLLLSILRAQGIPSRTVHGDGLGPSIDKTLVGIGHQWVGVWFPDAGWIPVEPTWSDSGNKIIGYDFDHFVWYVASKSVNDPNGFNCYTSDSQTPCRDAFSIDTKSVDTLPDKSQLQTIAQIVQKVDNAKKQGTALQQTLQQGVIFLGYSRLGRVVLSTQGMLFLSAIVLYLFLFAVISKISLYIRAKRQIGVGVKSPGKSI